MENEKYVSSQRDPHEEEYSKGDKNQPMAGVSETDRGINTQNIKKEASQPGGDENAAGKNREITEDFNRKGSGPLQDDVINKGDSD